MGLRVRSLTGSHLCFWREVWEEPWEDVDFSWAADEARCAMKEAAFAVTVPRMHSGGVSVCLSLFGIWPYL